jgi:formylglycine-generating enzyme required for sulfatase activity
MYSTVIELCRALRMSRRMFSAVSSIGLLCGAPACDVVAPDGPDYRLAPGSGVCSTDRDCAASEVCRRNTCACANSALCTCTAGWAGPTCLSPICSSRCLNGGTCIAPDTCSCAKGWAGPTCETCATGWVGAQCEACATGWEGANCDIRAPEGFVAIRPGRFSMGSPNSEAGRDGDETLHSVTLTRSLWLQATEVTQAQWQAVMGPNPSIVNGCGTCPASGVSWNDAVIYLNALSESEGLDACYEGSRFVGLDCSGYRLPTEAEWEYAVRAGTTEARYGELDRIAWHGGNAGYSTHPVAQKDANAWGLHDMLGNVWEWVHDRYGDFGGDTTDPTGPSSGPFRVIRGGGWSNDASLIRAANRYGYSPSYLDQFIGFRVARSIP